MAKCYIIACVVCGKLFDATGRKAISCSSTCRVWLKRHPQYSQLLREICRKLEIMPFDILRLKLRGFCDPILTLGSRRENSHEKISRLKWRAFLKSLR